MAENRIYDDTPWWDYLNIVDRTKPRRPINNFVAIELRCAHTEQSQVNDIATQKFQHLRAAKEEQLTRNFGRLHFVLLRVQTSFRYNWALSRRH